MNLEAVTLAQVDPVETRTSEKNNKRIIFYD
jgi:hypothetical protein